MSTKCLGLVHTSATLVPIFTQLCREGLEGVDLFHIADDGLLKGVLAKGRLTPHLTRRVVDHITWAEEAGADVVLATCSSIGPAVEAAVPLTGVPVLRVDQPMADRAVETGRRIGVIATLPTTLEPTADLIRRRAAAAGKSVEVADRLCEGAFDALMSGDAARHDAMVSSALGTLGREVDVIVLAQASMARVVEGLAAEERRVPILASPRLAVEHLAGMLGGPAG
jgi:Asp/Glu/hydantoin racemase